MNLFNINLHFIVSLFQFNFTTDNRQQQQQHYSWAYGKPRNPESGPGTLFSVSMSLG